MAEEVAKWRDLYNVDGIDLDIEAGAGDQEVRKRNTTQKNYKCFSISGGWAEHVAFIKKLKSLVPEMIVSQPVYGYPKVLLMVTLEAGS